MSMSERFAQVPKITIPRARYDRTHDVKTTLDPDFLVPVLIDPIYPGDSVQLNMSFICRQFTALYPALDQLVLESFFFFVPNRLLWENWHKFLGEQEDPGDSIDYTLPVVTLDTDAAAAHGTLGDYFGIPLIDYNTSNYTCQAMPIRSYYKVWNDHFRDENLQPTVSQEGESAFSFTLDDGPDSDGRLFTNNTVHGLQKRGKRKDYFTGSLPWTQKQTEAVTIPGSEIDVITDSAVGDHIGIYSTDQTSYQDMSTDGTAGGEVELDATPVGSAYKMYVDTSESEISINALRLAIQTQRFLEKDARAGTRAHEVIYSHYGVSPPHMAWRSEFLGGGSTVINSTPVAVTADTGTYNPGDLAAAGTGFGTGHGFTKSFTEHGWLLGLINIRLANQSYTEGFERWWQDSTRYDIMWPSLQFTGEQAVLNREIFIDDATITAGTDDSVFGYQEKYGHLKYKEDKITGLFRSNAGTTLDVWHYQEEFGSTPTLDATFITSNAEEGVDRNSGAPSEPLFKFNAKMQYHHSRTMAVYSVPGMMDHF